MITLQIYTREPQTMRTPRGSPLWRQNQGFRPPHVSTAASGLVDLPTGEPSTTNDFQDGSPRIASYPHYAHCFLQGSSTSPLMYNQQTVQAAENFLIHNRRKAITEAAPVIERLRGLGFLEEKMQEIGGMVPQRREYYIRRAYMVKTVLRSWRRGNRQIDMCEIPIDEQRGSVDDDLDLVYFGVLNDCDLTELYGAGKETLRFIGGKRGLNRQDMIGTLEDALALRLFLPASEGPVMELLRRFMDVIEQYRSTGSHSCTISNLKEASWTALKEFVDNAW